MREMLDRVGQSHFAILPAPVASAISTSAVRPEDVGTLGFDVRLLGQALVVSRVDPQGPADKAGVRAGWTLTRVGARALDGALASARRCAARTSVASGPGQLGTALLRGQAGEDADLGFLDASDKPVSRLLVRAPERGQPVKLGHLPTLFARLDDRRLERRWPRRSASSRSTSG